MISRRHFPHYPAPFQPAAALRRSRPPAPFNETAMVQRLHRQIPATVHAHLVTLQRHGHQAFVTGGAVRDAFLDRSVRDWDISTSATPDQVRQIFSGHKINLFGLSHGFVTLEKKSKGPDHLIDIYTFRSHRRTPSSDAPCEWEFTGEIAKDLAHRDLTINAIAYDPISGQLTDPHHGVLDLSRGLVRTVGTPRSAIERNAINPFRAVKFCARLGFTMDAALKREIPRHLDAIAAVSISNRREEIYGILQTDRPSVAFDLMLETGMLTTFLPELAAADGWRVKGRSMSQYRYLVASCDACKPYTLKKYPFGAPLLRLVALLHEITWPNPGNFHVDAIDNSTKTALAMMVRLGVDACYLEELHWLVHNFICNVHRIPPYLLSAENFKKKFSSVAHSNWLNVLILYYATQSVRGVGDLTHEAMVDICASFNETWMQFKRVHVTGKEIMETLKLKPGAWLDWAISHLQVVSTWRPYYNSRERQLELLRTHREEFLCLLNHEMATVHFVEILDGKAPRRKRKT